jgi:DNA-binding MarR family transcriptional regulator
MKIQEFLRQSPTMRILAAAREMEIAMRDILSGESLNLLQALVLVSLFFEEGTESRPSELHETFSTTKSHISHCISRLEELGFVKRSPEMKDRRACRVRLTAKGSEACRDLIRYFDRLQAASESALTPISLSTFLEALDTLVSVHSGAPERKEEEPFPVAPI